MHSVRSATKPLRDQLLDALATVVPMDPVHKHRVLTFLSHTGDKVFFSEVEGHIQRADASAVVRIVEGFLKQDDSVRSQFPQELHSSFLTTIRLSHLLGFLNSTSSPQTLALHRGLAPPLTTQQRFEVLVALKRIMGSLPATDLPKLHNMYQNISPDDETSLQQLRELLRVGPEMFFVLGPFRQLLYLDVDELKSLRDAFITFTPDHLIMIANLMALPDSAPLEFRALFCMDKMIDDFGAHGFALGLSGEQLRMDVRDSSDEGEEDAVQTMRLEILEQPPQKCVYRRNLRPAPMVNVVGIVGRPKRLFVVVKVLRCDTGEEIDNESAVTGLQSDLVQRVAVGTPVTFDKIKVGLTSHQLNDSYMALKFELREYEEGDDAQWKPVHSLQSVPFQVVAHSNQMKKPAQLPPEVQEVIPANGNVRGGTQVVVLGNNFFDSPGLRVRFGQHDVQPQYRGPRTLVCRSPPATREGPVEVAVTNDGHKFGLPRRNSFTYLPQLDPGQRPAPGAAPASSSLFPGGGGGGGIFDDFPMPSFVDLRRSTDMMRLSTDGLDHFYLSNSFDTTTGHDWNNPGISLKGGAFDLSDNNNNNNK